MFIFCPNQYSIKHVLQTGTAIYNITRFFRKFTSGKCSLKENQKSTHAYVSIGKIGNTTKDKSTAGHCFSTSLAVLIWVWAWLSLHIIGALKNNLLNNIKKNPTLTSNSAVCTQSQVIWICSSVSRPLEGTLLPTTSLLLLSPKNPTATYSSSLPLPSLPFLHSPNPLPRFHLPSCHPPTHLYFLYFLLVWRASLFLLLFLLYPPFALKREVSAEPIAALLSEC